ncbi:MAG: hypothetical protein QXR92_06960 [Fervidicoccaceae archaeon]
MHEEEKMSGRLNGLLALILLIIALSFYAQAQAPADVSIQSVNFKSQQNSNVYPGSSNAQLRIDVQFNVNASNPIGNLKNLPPGFSPSSGYSTSSGGRDLYGNAARNVTAGETIYFLFYLNIDKSVQPGTYYIDFSITYMGSNGDIITDYFRIPVQISPYPTPQIIVTSYAWNPAGYPGTHGTSLQITLENDGQSTLSSASVNILLPDGISIDNSQIQLGTLNSGSRISVTFSGIDIDSNVQPGNYTAYLQVNALMTTADGVSYNSTFNIPFEIAVLQLPEKYRELNVLSAYWGDVRPQPAYSNSMYAQLNVIYVNAGDYAISSIQTVLVSSYISPVQVAAVYYGSLQGGSSTTMTYYLSINSSSFLQEIPMKAVVFYRVDLGGGSYVEVGDDLNFTVNIESYPLANEKNPISLVSWGWQNGYSVFPKTRGAILSITVSNNLPFSISGANFTLLLPEGFDLDSSTREIFASNPIPAYGSFSMQFKINVGDVSPGSYRALVLAEYLVNSGGPGFKQITALPINFNISDESEAVQVLNWGWTEGSADVFSYGSNYYVIIRNLKFDAVNNPVLLVYLPSGFLFSSTNTSMGGVLPASSQSVSQVIPLQNIQEYIQQSVSSNIMSSSAPSSYQKGSSLYFTFPLNINLNSTGTYYANASLSFVDVWGNMREIQLKLPLTVYGSVNYIDVRISGMLDIRNKYTNLTVLVKNEGSSPAYNVYLTLSPPSSILTPQSSSSILIASPSTIYIKKIDAGQTISIPVTFVYNPFSSQSIMGSTSIVNYGVVPLQISVQYRDAGGQQHSFNNQIAIAVEPFIDLSLSGVSTFLSNGTLRVSGMLINYGSQTAYRISIDLFASNSSASTFIGDLDAGSQTAFRLDLQVPPSINKENVTMVISYYNGYNELTRKVVEFSVTAQPPEAPVQTTQQPSLLSVTEIRIAVVMVGIFLLLSGMLIFRMYRAHSKKIREMEEA